jgi:hypothetical protein
VPLYAVNCIPVSRSPQEGSVPIGPVLVVGGACVGLHVTRPVSQPSDGLLNEHGDEVSTLGHPYDLDQDEGLVADDVTIRRRLGHQDAITVLS